MRFPTISVAYAAILGFSGLIVAQEMLDFSQGALPSCAQQCTTLTNAQTGCIPAGGAPVSNPQTYKSCFCQSALLTSLKSGTNTAVCNGQCQGDDLQQIAKWYTDYCNSSDVPTDGGSGNDAGNNGATTAAGGAAPQPTPTTSTDSTSGDDGGQVSVPVQGSWWDKHGRWIIMVIVLIIGFAIIIGVSLWYKKRYYRKRAATLAAPSGWNPHESNYPYPGSTEKVLGSRSNTASPALGHHERGSSIHRLSKLVGR